MLDAHPTRELLSARPGSGLNPRYQWHVAAIIFHPNLYTASASRNIAANNPRILLAKNTLNNKWQLPGGSMVKSDADIFAALKRHVLHDTGLDIEGVVNNLADEAWKGENGPTKCLSFIVHVRVRDVGKGTGTVHPNEGNRRKEDVTTRIDVDDTAAEDVMAIERLLQQFNLEEGDMFIWAKHKDLEELNTASETKRILSRAFQFCDFYGL